MSRFQGKIDFLKLKNACIINVKGKTDSKQGVFIPIEDNHLFLSIQDDNKIKGAYFNFMLYEIKQPSKFGDTHVIKQNFNKEVFMAMTEEEKNQLPILGNIKPFSLEKTPQGSEVLPASMNLDDDDPLPF